MTTPLQKAADMETTDPKVAIVTGASQGIGAGLVEAYHRRNYAVVANSRTISTSHDPGCSQSQATSPILRPRNSW